MSSDVNIIALPQPTKTHRFVKVENGEEHTFDLPIDRNFNDGTGVLFYCNLGFVPYEAYMEKKHEKEVKERQAAASEKKKGGSKGDHE